MTNDYGNLELHQVLLAAMKDIDKICRENGLRYYLYAGTLLGAMNHKGFIPWDDDIDLAMFPDEFKRFAQIINEQYSDWYYVCIAGENAEWYTPANKFFIRGTKLIHEKGSLDMPLFIDFCLLHSVPDGKIQRFFQRKQLELISLVWSIQAGHVVPNSLKAKLSIGLLAKIKGDFWNKYFTKVATKYDKSHTQYVGTMFDVLTPNPYNGKNGYDKDITPRYWHEEPVNVPFEDCMFMTLSDPVTDLNDRYPNWQKPYPKEKRASKHGVNSYYISEDLRKRISMKGDES